MDERGKFLPTKKPDHEWWREKVAQLRKLADPVERTDPLVVYEKNGSWPLLKLVIMSYMMGPYYTIMNAERKKGNWSELHYIDVQAGNGLTRLGEAKKITVGGTALIGANFHSIKPPGFDYYHFVEPHEPWAKVLERRLALVLPAERFKVHACEPVEAVSKIVGHMSQSKRKPHFLAVVDPEGFKEITLPDLKPLFDFGRGDFMFNFQFQGAKRAPLAATHFFGDAGWPDGTDEEVREYFWKRVGTYGRPKGAAFTVKAGDGHGRYAYDVYYSAAQTAGGNPWLSGAAKDLQARMNAIGSSGTGLDFTLNHKPLSEYF